MKTAIVTGGTSGIGLAIVKMLAAKGYRVLATYSSNDMEEEIANVETCRADQSDKERLRAFVAWVKQTAERVDCIVLNAGITLRKGLTDFSDEEWERVVQVNVNAPTFLLRDLYPIIPHGSRIIFIGSEMAVHPHGTSLAYGVTKSAVHALSLNLVKFFEGTGTTVNTIAPGCVETPWQANKPQAIRDSICSKTAIHRFATVDEIADAVRFCIDNAFVNGSVIEVNGGYCYK